MIHNEYNNNYNNNYNNTTTRTCACAREILPASKTQVKMPETTTLTCAGCVNWTFGPVARTGETTTLTCVREVPA